VALDPHAHIAARLCVVRGRVVRLVGARAEEAVAVTERRGVRLERAQLLHQQLAFSPGSESSAWRNEFMSLIASRTEKVTEHGLHNAIGATSTLVRSLHLNPMLFVPCARLSRWSVKA
jgi:hypothetical protein